VLDVKTGAGAFMPTLEQALDLTQSLVDIGNGLGTETVALITDMNQPLGKAVGNALEVQEAIQTLKGSGPQDLSLLCEKLSLRMLSLTADPAESGRAKTRVAEALGSGKALEKFAQMVEAQGGDPRVIDDPALLPQAALQEAMISPSDGFITGVNARTVGRVSMALGAGRDTLDSRVDPSVGILLNKKIGDRVEKGEPLCTVFYNQAAKFESVRRLLLEAFVINPDRVQPPPLIKRIVE
jgi:pyrimidine-nucleoside phosphorylase